MEIVLEHMIKIHPKPLSFFLTLKFVLHLN